jgi:hypothetical protein
MCGRGESGKEVWEGLLDHVEPIHPRDQEDLRIAREGVTVCRREATSAGTRPVYSLTPPVWRRTGRHRRRRRIPRRRRRRCRSGVAAEPQCRTHEPAPVPLGGVPPPAQPSGSRQVLPAGRCRPAVPVLATKCAAFRRRRVSSAGFCIRDVMDCAAPSPPRRRLPRRRLPRRRLPRRRLPRRRLPRRRRGP